MAFFSHLILMKASVCIQDNSVSISVCVRVSTVKDDSVSVRGLRPMLPLLQVLLVPLYKGAGSADPQLVHQEGVPQPRAAPAPHRSSPALPWLPPLQLQDPHLEQVGPRVRASNEGSQRFLIHGEVLCFGVWRPNFTSTYHGLRPL